MNDFVKEESARRPTYEDVDPTSGYEITVAALCTYLTRCAGLGRQVGAEAERFQSRGDVHPDGHRVAEHLANHPVTQVPQVTRPHALDTVAVRQLAAHRLHAPARPAQLPRPRRLRVV